ncbi:MAG: phage major capsid protein [Oscillospiraceae bacterium]|nr:phage major capsid protein [Oscillospiraceae bacterium]MBR3239854.1 phage major capsid protein [Oscillospiraceae bacterium]
MELKEMTVEDLEARQAQIVIDIEAPEADLDAIEEEARSIKAELEARRNAEAQKAEIRSSVASGEGTVVKKIEKEERKIPTMEEIRNSKEYINAYAEYIKTGDDAECRALVSENATNGTIPVPELVYEEVRNAWNEDGIMSRVRKSYLKGNLKVGFEISATGAEAHNEGAPVTEETLTLGIVNLVPKSIKKWVSISDEALDLSGEAFLRYIYDEVAHQIAKKAADLVIASIEACTTVSTTTCPSVQKVSSAVSIGAVAQALGQISDQAANPAVIMNKATWSAFKAAQYAADYAVDPFEGLPVLFNNSIKAYSAATTGETYAIVGDLGYGAQANFPNGEEITFKFDEMTLATSDLVRIIGREFVGLGVVAPDAFCKLVKA